jgi:hypothetical protein
VTLRHRSFSGVLKDNRPWGKTSIPNAGNHFLSDGAPHLRRPESSIKPKKSHVSKLKLKDISQRSVQDSESDLNLKIMLAIKVFIRSNGSFPLYMSQIPFPSLESIPQALILNFLRNTSMCAFFFFHKVISSLQSF